MGTNGLTLYYLMVATIRSNVSIYFSAVFEATEFAEQIDALVSI